MTYEGNSEMDSIVERRTKRRFERKARKRPYVATDLGRAVCGQILPALAGYLLTPEAPQPPKGLGGIIRRLPADELALIALSGLLNRIDIGWKRDDPSARMKLCLAIGRDLRDQLEAKGLLEADPVAYKRVMAAGNRYRAIWKYRQTGWLDSTCVRAGNWLLDCATALDFFDIDKDGFPRIDEGHQKAVDLLREELIERHPFYLPNLQCPPDWEGWRNGTATFMRDSHPETAAAIEAAFADGSIKQHADGVNALQRVPFVINERLLPVVRKFATGALRDVAVAKYLAGAPFYTKCNIDFRGRVYPLPHFNFTREDRVRSLFMFANGAPVGDSVEWLEIAAANSFGKKGKWRSRRDWAFENRELIRRVAEDPIVASDQWRQQAKEPFSFVASCLELVAAQRDRSFVTRLPVLLDGSCNGIQHLALMTRGEGSGRLVNLTDADEIFDLYDTVTNGVNMKLMAADDENAAWWVERGVTRELLKQPIMTFSYGVTPAGARNQIIDACKNHNACPSWEQAQYLAKTVLDVSKVLLPRPALAMGFVRDLTKRQAERGLSLEWISPTGVPVVNRYHKSKVKPVEMQLRGTTVTYRIADGYEPRILKRDAADAAPANLVHSMDAAHLIRSVNAAAEEGIEDFVTVHDSYGTIAPRVTRFQQVVRRELALMYLGYDALARLWARNGAPDDLTIPEAGGLDPFEVQNSEYSFK